MAGLSNPDIEEIVINHNRNTPTWVVPMIATCIVLMGVSLTPYVFLDGMLYFYWSNRARKSRTTLQNKVRLKVLPEQLTLFVNTSVTFKKCIIR